MAQAQVLIEMLFNHAATDTRDGNPPEALKVEMRLVNGDKISGSIHNEHGPAVAVMDTAGEFTIVQVLHIVTIRATEPQA